MTLTGTGKTGNEDHASRVHGRTKGTDIKRFSPDRVNGLLPRIAPLVDELLAQRRELAICLLEAETMGRSATRPGSRLAEPRSTLPEPQFGERKSAIVRLIHRIEAFGCIVKDIDLGLLDFPSERDGSTVYLCWKAGEPEVRHWHGVDEGFSQRKAL